MLRFFISNITYIVLLSISSIVSVQSQELIGMEWEEKDPIRWYIYADTAIYDGFIEQTFYGARDRWKWELADDFGDISVDQIGRNVTATLNGKQETYTIRRIFPTENFNLRISNKNIQIEVKRGYASDNCLWSVYVSSQLIMEIECSDYGFIDNMYIYENQEYTFTAAQKIAILYAMLMTLG